MSRGRNRNRGGATCIVCGATVPFDHIRDEGQAVRMGARQLPSWRGATGTVLSPDPVLSTAGREATLLPPPIQPGEHSASVGTLMYFDMG